MHPHRLRRPGLHQFSSRNKPVYESAFAASPPLFGDFVESGEELSRVEVLLPACVVERTKKATAVPHATTARLTCGCEPAP